MQSSWRIAKALPACTRLFVSSATRYSFGSPSRPIRAAKFVHALRKETRDSTWDLVEKLNHPHRLALSEALFKHGLTVNQFKSWSYVCYKSNILAAVSALKDAGYTTRESDTGMQHPPTWLLLFLVSTKVRTSAHAEGPLMDLVFSNFPVTSPEYQGPLLVLTMINLVRFSLLLPMERVIQTFLNIPLHHPELEFNLMLQAITSIHPSSMEVGKQVLQLLRAVEARQLHLTSESYTALLRDRFVTLQLTRYLREQMARQGYAPTATQLEAYLKVFSRNGLIHDAKRYYDIVRAGVANHDRTVALTPSTDDESSILHSAETSMLRAQGDRASAFEYLVKLLKADQERQLSPHDIQSVPSRLLSPPRTDRHSLLPWRKSVDVYDWTTAFAVAAKDSTTNAATLLRVFRRVKFSHDAAFRPTLVTYTVLLRGLYARQQYTKAQREWLEMLRSGITPDAHAMGIGLQILTRVGKPHEALATLEAYASRVNAKAPAVYSVHRPVPVGIMEINLFMVSLNRSQRPDVVFKLWDHMEALYNIQPNAITLSILLQAVRIANKLDDTLSGAVAQLALRNPFRKAQVTPTSRNDILASFRDIAGTPRGKVKPYVSGIWHERPPFEEARKIFLQVVFGQAPDRLRDVKAPACARLGPQLTQGHGLPRSHPRLAQNAMPLPPDLLTKDGRSHFPTIVPTDTVCFNYIILLGTSGKHHEIPLVLAWMRALDIRPSRQTLSVALVFWAEVGMQPPLIEQLTGGPEESEYARLVEWMEDWVGKAKMPADADLRKWFGVVVKMNKASR
ncbi:hypothetical protein HGRIS_006730 [Hohenbuehelia grisea]|uniref:Pentatricopeptide repeat-containing protein n=1 Tax=Hohenbuehelia grisea TaxID=104357 RepID=A0ABR3JA79_9AGAR